MRTKPVSSCAICLCLLVAASSLALAAAKHFRVSSEHFHDYAAKAAELYFKAEQPGEKHILSNLSSISSIYTEKAATVASLVDVLDHMIAKRDRVYTQDRIHDIKRQYALSLPQDIKLLSDLVEPRKTRPSGPWATSLSMKCGSSSATSRISSTVMPPAAREGRRPSLDPPHRGARPPGPLGKGGRSRSPSGSQTFTATPPPTPAGYASPFTLVAGVRGDHPPGRRRHLHLPSPSPYSVPGARAGAALS